MLVGQQIKPGVRRRRGARPVEIVWLARFCLFCFGRHVPSRAACRLLRRDTWRADGARAQYGHDARPFRDYRIRNVWPLHDDDARQVGGARLRARDAPRLYVSPLLVSLLEKKYCSGRLLERRTTRLSLRLVDMFIRSELRVVKRGIGVVVMLDLGR